MTTFCVYPTIRMSLMLSAFCGSGKSCTSSGLARQFVWPKKKWISATSISPIPHLTSRTSYRNHFHNRYKLTLGTQKISVPAHHCAGTLIFLKSNNSWLYAQSMPEDVRTQGKQQERLSRYRHGRSCGRPRQSLLRT